MYTSSASAIVADHRALFADEDPRRCDACDTPLEDDDALPDALGPDDSRDRSGSISGWGLYVWSRGDKLVHEAAPLCQACASAIGVVAQAQHADWEDEG